MSAANRALFIHTILDQVISELHWTHCAKCWRTHFGIDIHLRGGTSLYVLYNCLLVSKFWASVVIPILWTGHGVIEHLMDDEWNSVLFGRHAYSYTSITRVGVSTHLQLHIASHPFHPSVNAAGLLERTMKRNGYLPN